MSIPCGLKTSFSALKPASRGVGFVVSRSFEDLYFFLRPWTATSAHLLDATFANANSPSFISALQMCTIKSRASVHLVSAASVKKVISFCVMTTLPMAFGRVQERSIAYCDVTPSRGMERFEYAAPWYPNLRRAAKGIADLDENYQAEAPYRLWLPRDYGTLWSLGSCGMYPM